MRDTIGRGRRPGLLFVCILALCPLDAAAAADEETQLAQGAGGAPGNLTAQALGKLPAGLPIRIVVHDDSEANLEIRDALAEALARAGHQVAEGASLELSFEDEVLEPHVETAEPTLGRIRSSNEAEVGNQGSARGVEAEVNVWSSTKDSLLGGVQGKGTTTGHPRYHLNVRLRDRDGGKVIWQGDSICEMLTGDRARLLRSMTRPLAEALGTTVTGEPFDIR